MKKRLFFYLLLLLSATLSAQTADTSVPTVNELPIEEELPWPLQMQARLDSMMRAPLLDDTQIGIMIWDLTDDHSLFAMNHRQLMRPASTMKLVTAITALDYLGPNHRFYTSLYYKGSISNRTLTGDIICVGGMDPAFDTIDLTYFVDCIKQLGVDTICGNIVADVSMKDTLKWGEGWCWDDKNPVLSPLLINRHADFTEQLQKALEEKGIIMKECTLKTGTLPNGASLICQRFRTMDQILTRMMKDSDNLYAESMYYQIAAKSERPGKALYAQRQQRALMERAGQYSSRFRLADGSGLSLYNYISAECLLSLLRYAYLRPSIYRQLLASLPIACEDGTLKKRMKGTAAAGNVQAKTGTLTGIISLAGYCTASNGHRLCFVIINQGVPKASDARNYQDKICTILCE